LQIHLLSNVPPKDRGDIQMKPTYGRVIKSEDIRYISRPRRRISGSSSGAQGSSASGPDDGTMALSDMEMSQERYLNKIRSAEQQAHEKGLSEGIRKGRALQKQETLQGVQALTTLIDEVTGLKKSMLEAAEEQILQLVLAVAEKLIHMEITTNREVIQSVLKAAMRNIVDRENMKVRVHPQDYQYLLEIKSDFLQSFDGIRNIVFEEDSSILRGGAIIETTFGEVDARLDQQYNEIKSFMTKIPHA
jgi:flagellar assembly protein FliH